MTSPTKTTSASINLGFFFVVVYAVSFVMSFDHFLIGMVVYSHAALMIFTLLLVNLIIYQGRKDPDAFIEKAKMTHEQLVGTPGRMMFGAPPLSQLLLPAISPAMMAAIGYRNTALVVVAVLLITFGFRSTYKVRVLHEDS